MSTNKDINSALISDLIAIYSQVELDMLERVSKRVAKGITDEGWNEKKLKETQALNKELQALMASPQKLAKKKVSQAIINAYKDGVNSANVDKGLHKSAMNAIQVPESLRQLVLDTNHLLDNASFQVLRNNNDVYRDVMARTTAMVLSGNDTRRQATQRALNEYVSKGVSGFTDKIGRHWSLASYAEMCTRTAGSHAALQGQVDRQLELGEDLVVVSSIGGTCKLCAKWQDVVLSITGKTPGYHTLEEARSAGLFHPNCKHTISMYITGLDDHGKKEPNSGNAEGGKEHNEELYNAIQNQRSNERHIRDWRRRKACAITDSEKETCNQKIAYYGDKNTLLCTKYGLRRHYEREYNMVGHANGAKAPIIGGTLSEQEHLLSHTLGQDSKEVFKGLGMNLQFFGSSDTMKKEYTKWLKDEIKSLDELDVDLSYLKDKNHKEVTPTSLYKKYIGDTPTQDYAEITEYEKGTKEYKTGYAKWLKEQVYDIGKSYKVKPEIKTIVTYVDEADIGLSPTEIYKKYYGKKPTEVFKELNGTYDKSAYSKWLTNEKKKLIKEGITKTVDVSALVKKPTKSPIKFDNAVVEKTKKTIANAKQAQKEANDLQIKLYKEELKSTAKGKYTASQAVKKASNDLDNIVEKLKLEGKEIAGNQEALLAQQKYDIAKEHDLKIIKSKVKNMSLDEIQTELDVLNKVDTSNMKMPAVTHIMDKSKVYEEAKKQIENEAEKKAKLIAEAEKKKALESIKTAHGEFKSNQEVIDACMSMDVDSSVVGSSILAKYKKKFKSAIKEMGYAGDINNKGKYGLTYFDIHDYTSESAKQKAIDEMAPWKAIGDYTSGSRPHNFCFKENKSAISYFNGARYTREQARQVDGVLDKAFEVPSAVIDEDIVVRHGNDLDGVVGLLGDDLDYESFKAMTYKEQLDMMHAKLDNLNKASEEGQSIVLEETGYLSTSPVANGGFVNKNVEVRILCPKGTRGLYVDEYSYYGGEEEMILPRNQKFRFVKAWHEGSSDFHDVNSNLKGSKGGSYIIFLEAIPK